MRAGILWRIGDQLQDMLEERHRRARAGIRIGQIVPQFTAPVIE